MKPVQGFSKMTMWWSVEVWRSEAVLPSAVSSESKPEPRRISVLRV